MDLRKRGLQVTLIKAIQVMRRRMLPCPGSGRTDADISLKSLVDEDGEASKHTVAY
ncbi:hypothetical protein FHS51_001493 [Sphingobium wenxiniae]|uniref:Uncharacterized protein n=1 Tax=Sphingobium baderi LL03 TaxID=1114964 RepID=T0HBL9_9SPHN|nr:hypothetical protein L485_22005 [Sphingobium baderi LL03]KMS64031.1 hypothetical protein V475_23520 [Sphingobium baderi LL03]MBB6191271.1 hypothetical protein [Sphingobium wenxiniae]